MTVSLDLDTVKTLALPTGNTPLVRALYLKRYHKTLVILQQLHQKLGAEAPDLVEQTGFAELFTILSTFPAAAQKAILTYPAAVFWAERAWNLARRQSHIRFPEMHMQTHLEEFGRIVLAAAAKAGVRDFECVTWTDANGRLVLPGSHIYLEGPNLTAYQRLKVKAHNGVITARAMDGARETQLKLAQNQVPIIAGSLELNAVDLDLQLPGHGSFVFDQAGPEELIKWRSTLEQSLFWVDECSPALTEELLMSLRAIVPVRSAAVNVHASASFREASGLIALSWTPDASVMVEALVHEYHHQKLNALLNLDPLIVGPSTEAIYYSPWRDDARPLLGVLHGAYAFQAVLQFWKSLFAADIPLLQEARIRQRMYLLKGQVRSALNTLRAEALFSPLGEALVDAMSDHLDNQNVLLLETERTIQQRLDQLQTEHRTRCKAKNEARLSNAIISQSDQSLHGSQTENERATLDWLRVNSDFDPALLKGSRYQPDPLLNAVIFAYHERGFDELKKILDEARPGESALLDLIKGHVAYILSEYERAAMLYESCLASDSSNTHFWQCFAFALRHLARWQEADMILTNLGRLSRAQPKVMSGTGQAENPVEDRLDDVRRILNPQSAVSMTTE